MGQIGLWQQSSNQNIITTEAYQLEIQQIYDSFFQMNHRLVNLNQETLKLELEALQFQINPHFLINTLNSIKILAQVRGNEEVVKMTKELMVIVNGLLHRTGMFTTLENELDCVTGYIHIQKIRFGDLFDYSIQVSDNLKELVIMKMIMQPIIENAIQHGFRKSDQRGHLIISARSETNELIIRIQDDSRQADFSKIERILDSAIENSITEEIDQHKGLRNIQRRIFLRYGRPWGVYVSLEEGMTTFTLRLPLLEKIGHFE
jgi:two-component system sensor histidine kinase YesM